MGENKDSKMQWEICLSLHFVCFFYRKCSSYIVRQVILMITMIVDMSINKTSILFSHIIQYNYDKA